MVQAMDQEAVEGDMDQEAVEASIDVTGRKHIMMMMMMMMIGC